MNEGFRWCPHCGKPHSLKDRTCAATGKPLDNAINQRAAPVARAAAASSPLIGAILGGKYRILRALGSGGMGTVFEAENLSLGRLVAVKIASRPDSKDALARFAREASIVASLQHLNICDVYDVGDLPNGAGPYIVLERLVGDTLHARLGRSRRVPTSELVDIFVQVLSGLQAAHTARILHRDLKPQNIFLVDRVGGGPLVKIVDFGLARDLSLSPASRLTKPGRLCGTLQYMSPEQLRGETLDQRSDVFSVGVIMYEALTGHHPFAAASSVELQTNILRADPIPLRSRRADVSLMLADMVSWALARTPAQRPSSAAELQRGLLAALRDRSSPMLDETEAEPASVTNPMWIPPSSSPAA